MSRIGGSCPPRRSSGCRGSRSVTGRVIAKVTEQAVDAGFVYATDVAATGGAAPSIPLPAGLQPRVAYAAAVVKGAAHPAQARAFINGLLSGAGQQDLLEAGFLPPLE